MRGEGLADDKKLRGFRLRNACRMISPWWHASLRAPRRTVRLVLFLFFLAVIFLTAKWDDRSKGSSAPKASSFTASISSNTLASYLTRLVGGKSEGDRKNNGNSAAKVNEARRDTSADSFTTITAPVPLSCPYYDAKASPFPASFWYVKTPKTASSTLNCVFRSIAGHHGVTMINPDNITMNVAELNHTIAKVLEHMRHEQTSPLGLCNHLKFGTKARTLLKRQGPLLIFTSVREPVAQFHSQYTQTCTRLAADEASRVKCHGLAVEERTAMARAVEADPQYAYIRGNATDVEAAAMQYDFIFVRERLEESLVAFMILYGLDIIDIVTVAVNVRTGGYPETAKMPAALNDLVRNKTTKDSKLYAKANLLLDEKIANIHEQCKGEAYFASTLKAFRSVQDMVVKECTDFRAWYIGRGFTPNHERLERNDLGMATRCRDFVVKREMRTAFIAATLERT